MGYSTYYTLEIIEGDDHKTDWEQEISEFTEYGEGVFEQEIKWYDHDKDMLEFSKKHPNMLFCLSGEGEENGDLWIKYYKDGKMQNCPAIITYEPFDPTKLQ